MIFSFYTEKLPGRIAQSVGHLTRSQGSWVRYPVWQHTFVSPSAFSRRAVVSYWRKCVHKVLVNCLGGLCLPRKSVVRLTGRPDMTLDVYSILFYPITLGGRRGTTDEFATIPFHLDLFSAALVELAKSIPVHSLILSSHLFFCLPLFLFPFTVPCRIVFAKPEDLETWPNHLSFRFLTKVRSSSYSPMAAWIFLRTSSLVTWSLYEMFNSLR